MSAAVYHQSIDCCGPAPCTALLARERWEAGRQHTCVRPTSSQCSSEVGDCSESLLSACAACWASVGGCGAAVQQQRRRRAASPGEAVAAVAPHCSGALPGPAAHRQPVHGRVQCQAAAQPSLHLSAAQSRAAETFPGQQPAVQLSGSCRCNQRGRQLTRQCTLARSRPNNWLKCTS